MTDKLIDRCSASGLAEVPARVLPLAALGETAAAPSGPTPDGVLRLAFLGAPVPHKGWEVFQDLVRRFSGDPRYAFVQLGAQGAGYAGMDFVEARDWLLGRPAALERLGSGVRAGALRQLGRFGAVHEGRCWPQARG